MSVRLYNTMSRSIEEFKPIYPGKALMYCCGPTVYNFAHIGNLRTFIFEDLLHRTLAESGYSVKHVMNITDVGHLTDDGDNGEDKMKKRAEETGKSVWDIAAFYTNAFFHDEEHLNIIRPGVVCKATDHVKEMIALIETLEKGGHTYVSGGNVYFSIDTITDYGKLARLNLEELREGARISVDENKRNPKDFALWFTNSKFQGQAMTWPSPWGVGYPGWHIECSAMSMKYLGDHFDIHCGGIDAIPVHHTNEIAQSEAASGKKPWVNYWCHGEFLLNDKGKMSKSKGEFLTLPLLEEKGYDPLDYRYFCLTGHYRSQLKFSFEALDMAHIAHTGLKSRIAQMKKVATPASTLGAKAQGYCDQFLDSMQGDLKAPQALSYLWGLVKDGDVSDGEKLTALYKMDHILGLRLIDIPAATEEGESVPEEVKALIEARTEAKKNRDFARADEIRGKIASLGYDVKDTAAGPVAQKRM